MGDIGVTVLAAEEGGTSNFLVPNGTFFFVLAIFLIVLGVIGKFVVPPIQQVLSEREAMVTRTAEDNRRAAQQEEAAEADYRTELATARAQAAGIRDETRAQGRAVLEDMRGRANEEVSGVLQVATGELQQQSDAIAPNLHLSVQSLAGTLASRVLGVEVSGVAVSGAPMAAGR